MLLTDFRTPGKVSSLHKDLEELTGVKQDIIKQKIQHIEHHRSHPASAFSSPFKEAALLTPELA
jgi:predicted NodU family carbamoyl transferase